MAHRSLTQSPSCGLTGLPIEILHLICTSLCCHCWSRHGKDEQSLPPYSYHSSGCSDQQKALFALSRVSKTLRKIAQPIAYHVVSLSFEGYRASKRNLGRWTKLAKLIRTLDQRPDLAAQVKQLFQYPGGHLHWGSDDAFQVFRGIARRLGMDRESDREFESARFGDDCSGRFCSELLTAMLPNLELLVSDIEDDENFEPTSCHYLKERSRKFGAEVVSMKSLKALDFRTESDWGVAATNPAVSVLLGLAPNLEQLIFNRSRGAFQDYDSDDNVVDPPRTVFPGNAGRSLRSVKLLECALEGDEDTESFISEIINHAPNLEHFQYSSRSTYMGESISHHFSAPDFLNCLQPVRGSLTLLDINLVNHSFGTEVGDLVEKAALKSFTKLDTLKLDDTSFCRHRHEPGTEANCLTNILPANLTTLTVRVFEDACSWRDLARLGTEAHKFPRLKQISVHVIDRKPITLGDIERASFEATIQAQAKLLEDIFLDTNIAIEVTDRRRFGYYS